MDLQQDSAAVGGTAPFPPLHAQVIAALPESPVENGFQPFHPRFRPVRGKGSVLACPRGFPVHGGNRPDVIRGTAAPFQLQHGNARVQKLVQHRNGAQVLGRHHVFVVYHQFIARFLIRHAVGAAAVLEAGPPVGGGVVGRQAHVAFAGHGHA